MEGSQAAHIVDIVVMTMMNARHCHGMMHDYHHDTFAKQKV